MPFTLAHPAAALPLAWAGGGRLVLSALMIGCLTPDLPYFLALPVARAQSHSLLGLLWPGLPLGLVGYAFFVGLVGPVLAVLLPEAVGQRLAAQREAAPRRSAAGSLVAVPVSLLLGAASHVVWDSFTHLSGAAVPYLPGLMNVLLTLPGYSLTVYRLLQHGSTALGLTLLAVSALRWYRRTPPLVDSPAATLPAGLRWAVLASFGLVLVGVGCGVLLEQAPRELSLITLRSLLGELAISLLSSLGLGLLLLGLAWRAAGLAGLPAAVRRGRAGGRS